MARLLPEDARAVFASVFENGCRRDPEFANLNALFALVLDGVLEPKEVAGPAAMIVVEMGEADDIIIIALRGAKVDFQFPREVNASIPRVVAVLHVGVVDEHFPTVGE